MNASQKLFGSHSKGKTEMNASQKLFASHSEGKAQMNASQKVLESTLTNRKRELTQGGTNRRDKRNNRLME
ncbi:hypothetical protein [Cytobacillus sp. FSL R7-0680]|uniref:hypothetical protein n=1 Tax=Cytobacillus sp. FSL R7-0680 TaxID=2921689 RepID=UPI0030F73169